MSQPSTKKEGPRYTPESVAYLHSLDLLTAPVWIYDAFNRRQAFANRYYFSLNKRRARELLPNTPYIAFFLVIHVHAMRQLISSISRLPDIILVILSEPLSK